MATDIDVLFINPGDRKAIYQGLGDEFSAIEPPVFAGLFATYLRNKGASVAIIDGPAFGWSAQEIAQAAYFQYNPKLIVIPVYGFQPSASTQNMTAAGQVAFWCQFIGKAPVLMTGTHPAALPGLTMEQESVDFVCSGEGPVTIYKTLQAIKDGTGFADIPSLWWRDKGEIVAPKSSEPLVMDLDAEMPGIAWDLLPMDKYRAHNWHSFEHINDRSPYGAIHTSLGCPYKCSFCCINAPFGKASYRMWSPDSVIHEIDTLVYKYGVKNIKFVDEMFVLNKDHINGICDRLISRSYKVNIWAYARVDTVKDEFLPKLKAAGFNWLCLGIESASGEVRDGARKKYGNQDIIDVVRKIQAAGINVIGNYIFGLPDDTVERMQETFDLAVELNCEFANFYSAMAYPGSPLYTQAVKDGKELPSRWQDYSQHGYNALPLANNYLTGKEILAFRDAAWHKYFTSDRYLNMVEEKFGMEVVCHLNRMSDVKLERAFAPPSKLTGVPASGSPSGK